MPGSRNELPARIRGIVSEVRAILERTYGERLAALIVFGSHARGEAVAGSDVDVLVVLHGEPSPAVEISRLSAALSDVSLRHDLVVSCAVVSESRYREERSPFLLNVRREGIAA